MPYATVDDLRLVYEGEILTSEEPRVTELIAATERRLDALVPNLTVRIASGGVTAGQVKDVVRDATLRRLRNPEGYISETAGDYSYRLGAAAAAGGGPLAPFSAAEIAMLRGGSGAPRAIRVATPGDGPAPGVPDGPWR